MTFPDCRPRRSLFAVLLPTLDCNLACRYCFEPHPPRRWSVDEAEHILAELFAMARIEAVRDLRLHWQGGEALLLGEDFWSRVLPKAEALAMEAHVSLEQRLQTNMTCWAPWVAPLAHRHLGSRLGTSWDGTDERRARNGGAAEFEEAFWYGFAQAEAAAIEVGVLALITPAVLRLGARAHLERMRGRGIKRLRLALPFSVGGRGDWIDAGAAGAFLAEAWRVWSSSGRDAWLQLKPFSFLERRLAGDDPAEPGLCVFAENCAELGLAVAPDGGAWLCDSCIGVGAPYGNGFRDGLAAAWRGPRRAEQLRACAALLSDRCLACRWVPVCQGGCFVRSRPVHACGRVDHYCESYRLLFSAIDGARACL